MSKINVKAIKEMILLADIKTAASRDRAKEMMLAGESWVKIMKETRLRLKDLKRIQRDEISSHF